MTVTKKSSELQRALLKMILAQIGTGVTVGVLVIVGVKVGVRVFVGVFVLTGVYVAVAVAVLVGVDVGEGVGVFDGTVNVPPPGLGVPAGRTICAIWKDSLMPARYEARWTIGSKPKIGRTIKVKL